MFDKKEMSKRFKFHKLKKIMYHFLSDKLETKEIKTPE